MKAIADRESIRGGVLQHVAWRLAFANWEVGSKALPKQHWYDRGVATGYHYGCNVGFIEPEQYCMLPVVPDVRDAELFRRLVSEWKRDTEYISSITEMATHPAYQRIIGMGERALPLLFRELAETPDHWFWALTAITRTDPVPLPARDSFEGMMSAWLEWGREQGYLD